MGQITPNISIYIPSDGETNYGQSFQAGMVNVDLHDHTGAPFKGVPIPSGGIANGAITLPKLNPSLYLKGAYTPVLKFGGASVGITYSTQAGAFVRFGDICFVYIAVALTSKGVSVGNATISLPFPGIGIEVLTCGMTNTVFGVGHTYITGQVIGTDSQFLTCGSGLPGLALTNVEFTNNSAFVMSGTYFIS